MTSFATRKGVSTQFGGLRITNSGEIEELSAKSDRTVARADDFRHDDDDFFFCERSVLEEWGDDGWEEDSHEKDLMEKKSGGKFEKSNERTEQLLAAVEDPFEEAQTEIRITGKGYVPGVIRYIITEFMCYGKTKIVLRGLGMALKRTVDIATMVQRKLPGLQIMSHVGSLSLAEFGAPDRFTSFIAILLTATEPVPYNERYDFHYYDPPKNEFNEPHTKKGPPQSRKRNDFRDRKNRARFANERRSGSSPNGPEEYKERNEFKGKGKDKNTIQTGSKKTYQKSRRNPLPEAKHKRPPQQRTLREDGYNVGNREFRDSLNSTEPLINEPVTVNNNNNAGGDCGHTNSPQKTRRRRNTDKDGNDYRQKPRHRPTRRSRSNLGRKKPVSKN